MTELKLHNFKSDGYHVFMERLILIALKISLPEFVWSALVEVSLLFHQFSMPILCINVLMKIENKVVGKICNLEKIFSLSFFDFTEHMTVNLLFEVRIRSSI